MSPSSFPAPPLRLGELDQAPISDGSTAGDALRNTLDLSRLADELGYHRYWVAEHHGTPMLAGASPEVLIGPIAATTTRIRVGSGGVMLPHYSPFKVAESFSILAGLFPNRIDLGVGRAAGTDARTALALQRDRRQSNPDDFPEQLGELLDYLDGTLPDGHPFARLAKLPGRPEKPEAWLLGSSDQSGIWAAEMGLPYAFADFINPAGAAITREYRRSYMPSELRPSPVVSVTVWALAAETDEEAERLASSSAMVFSLFDRGRMIQVPTVETALRFFEEEGIPPGRFLRPRRRIVGSPLTVRTGIETVAREYQADEVLLVTITHDHAARRRSYELVAEAFDLASQVRDTAFIS
ncbi:MAG: LLM class flavin-dependent oxidoreductase [Gemmatimonadota bacterium]